MTLAVWFWILMVLWLCFGLWSEYIPGQPYPVRRGAWNVLVFVLLVILGMAQFGGPIK
jgi:hypothetical protein